MMQVSDRASPIEDRVEAMLAQLRPIATSTNPTHQALAGRLLADLRASVNGQFPALVRELRPDLARPDAWAKRLMAAHGEPSASALTAASAASPVVDAGRSLGSEGPQPLDDRSRDLFPRLRPLLNLGGRRKREAADTLAASLGVSRGTVYRWIAAVKEGGAAALNRRRRSDAGKVRVDPKVQQAFLGRRLGKATKHETVAVSIARVREQFPELDISESSLRRLDRSAPIALRLGEDDWRKRFLPGGPVEAPYPNHTHTFDMTIGDLFVWDRDPATPPYRPWFTGIVDERTQAIMFGLYTRGRESAPSTADLQAVLLHAWLPKSDAGRWPMCGAPEYLHCDNGKVQDSKWLEAVCEQLGTELGLVKDVRHTEVYSGWQQGHAERFFRILHERLESQLGCCYCGNDPQHKPECLRDPSGGIKVWQQYPTLESLNAAFQTWVQTEYLDMYHRRLKMTRREAWRLESPGHVTVPDTDYLYEVLLQREERVVRRGKISLLGYTYWHPVLQGYEERRLQVRWDPADLTKVLVLLDGGTEWAEREETRFTDQPQTIAEHRQQRRQKKAHRKALEQATEIVSTTDAATFDQTVRRMKAARRGAGIVDFPRHRVVKPEEADEPDAAEIIDLLEPTPPGEGGEQKAVIPGLELD